MAASASSKMATMRCSGSGGSKNSMFSICALLIELKTAPAFPTISLSCFKKN